VPQRARFHQTVAKRYHPDATMTDKINLAEKFSLFSEHWRHKTITALNGQEIKLIKGEPWRA
jgi:hypothetical protein